MKNINRIIVIILVTGIGSIVGCKKKSDPTPVDPKQEIINNLTNTWSVSGVTMDGQDVSADWTDFALTIDLEQNYAATDLSAESVLIWPVIGSYTFPNTDNSNVVLRNDGVQITISNLTVNSVQLSFQISGRNNGGRTEGLLGNWLFEMEN